MSAPPGDLSSQGPLRVCVYGSSSARTSKAVLEKARELGAEIANRGHICVNGAGMYGCMGALNDGCLKAGGEVIGAIHEMWVPKEGSPAESSELHKGLSKNLIVVGGDTLTERKKAVGVFIYLFIYFQGD